MKYDLAVAYRIYPGVSKVPPAYPHDKLKLARFCLESFKKSLEGITTKVIVLLDKCPEEYEMLFLELFKAEDVEFIRLDGVGNKKTFNMQMEILSTQTYADTVYFAEDDYFYVDTLKNAFDFIQSGEADFVSPYEHPSCYTDGHQIANYIALYKDRRYTTVQHACLTFMTTRKNLIANRKMLSIYSKYFASDYVVWGCITLGFTFFKYMLKLVNLRHYTLERFKVYGAMWFFAWYRFIFNKKYKLYMPIPTIATHMESNFLSPGINWHEYFKNAQQ